ncbi:MULTISPECIES: GNAT family N-acetyltransferase [Ochrobactrum]|jgi:GNAT superfamily N-acetyltransferase|uniref:FR47-like family protein n=1 Tax=Ochrobactrum quorumnocens TaxID=271865 RepID=A0A248ULD9_9HYPH|nr:MULTISPECIES: GNAT family N-acetyltransferase [Brucella/Ochrobactrum group]MBD7992537.1 GNAT family N-acetyltransferase [Ochrobactrum gallinarum]ASV87677.1 FR47-like family protein [[Ochrobactrum] quorumnocens]KAA9366646.1 GNAT family N-acetyltransferase [[Ochrobactrum] quorumnocens]MCV9906293.1 GNAT family N-acetyltransferase [Brucella sp. HL-2]MDH7790119.1 GNAT superfamily N-acetyltransferase [Ochrobactrum sp. AN78]
MTALRICLIGSDFDRWKDLLRLIQESFAYMDGIIDPPSSARHLTADNLQEKAKDETGFAAFIGEELAGCVFIKEKDDHFYLGKLAVARGFEGQGTGRNLVEKVEQHAVTCGKPVMELQTRIELTRNHAVFEKLGYRKVAETAHTGFTRTTSITMRKEITRGTDINA